MPAFPALLEQAAELRAQGLAWETIAAELNRSERQIRKLRQLHRERWTKVLARAEQDYIRNAAAESVSILRTQLRNQDEETKQKAALTLLRHETARRPKPVVRRKPAAKSASAEAIRMAEFVEGLSDAEFHAILGEVEGSAGTPDVPVDAANEAGRVESTELPERVS